jgi:hypothetical protein
MEPPRLKMIPVHCPTCGGRHDLAHLEPSFSRPDAFIQIPSERRTGRAPDNDEGCILVSEDGKTLTYYVRTVLRIPVHGELNPIGWGVWAEVDHGSYMTIVTHVDDPDQAALGPFPGTLANRLPHYPDTLGLPGSIRLTGPVTRPEFSLAPGSEHPFAREATVGVVPERALEWRLWSIHPAGGTA